MVIVGKTSGEGRGGWMYEEILNTPKNLGIEDRVEFLGESYAAGAKVYEEDEEAKREIASINLKIYQKDSDLQAIWERGRKWSLEYFEEIYKRVGTIYKRYYFESEVAEKGRQLVLDNVDNGVFERHEGAVVFRGGDHTRVFVTKEDYATYEAKDMALAGVKYKDFAYDRSIIITAHEQGPYFKVVLAAMEQIFPELARKTSNITFGFVRLKDEKMSSRLGNIIAGEWLLDEAKRKISESFAEMDDKTLEIVAVGAVKYSMLKFARESDIQFSFEESINLEGNSGPYIQYTYARTQSVVRKSQIANNKSQINLNDQNLKLENEELEIIRMLSKFSEVIGQAGDNFAPNILCNFLFELCQKFNLFYQKHKIIGSDKEDFRLALTKAVGQVTKNGLYLLGIESPEKM
ncbi:MAG: arginine--tRNA ligase [Candidatus Levybacteria bacterium]|nr:arginine--tRNA ligase [Candidatus Levybacteria bacterium]